MKAREKILRYDRALDCVHCGLCLPACPTYRLTGKESASPRGRIYAMRAIAEGRLEETPDNLVELDRCLVCRACETVCPSGVEFGEMMELTRDIVEPTEARAKWTRRVKRWLFHGLLPHPLRLKWAVELGRWYQLLGLKRLSEIFGFSSLFGRRAVLREALMPAVPPLGQRSDPPQWTEPEGAPRSTVGFLVGCLAHELLPNANRAAIRVLQRNGCRVYCPPSRPCCGALPVHFGDLDAARELAKKTMAAFDDRVEWVVVSSAGCASAMKEAPRLFPDDSPERAAAEAFSRKVRDFSEFLVELPLTPPLGQVEARVAFDAPCHLVHAQGIRSAPLQLLQSVPGITYVEFAGQEDCCGAAGLSVLTEPEQSVQLLEEKVKAVAAADVELLVTANPGCQLHLKSGAREWYSRAEVLHLAELLDRAYSASADSASSSQSRQSSR